MKSKVSKLISSSVVAVIISLVVLALAWGRIYTQYYYNLNINLDYAQGWPVVKLSYTDDYFEFNSVHDSVTFVSQTVPLFDDSQFNRTGKLNSIPIINYNYAVEEEITHSKSMQRTFLQKSDASKLQYRKEVELKDDDLAQAKQITTQVRFRNPVTFDANQQILAMVTCEAKFNLNSNQAIRYVAADHAILITQTINNPTQIVIEFNIDINCN